MDWTGYTVHDAANILRRYFNQLPEPIIPLEFYQRFRDPLRNHQAQAVGAIEAQSPSEGEFDHVAAIRAYQNLITELPPLNRQLLLYILDLLAVFASKSDLNKMTTPNLAAIFQPGILNHPQHDMAPQEYRLSQDVLIFLIENQDSFLIGMQGTAADPETVRDVQSGSPVKPPSTPTTPNRSKTVIGRSSSSSSVAAESVRKWGSIRRNVSVSSKHSKRSESNVPPSTPTPVTPTSGVHRSNTVPSRRGGSSAQSPRFSKDKNSDPSTPNPPSSSAGATIAPPGVVETIIQRPSTSERPSSIQNTPTASTAPAFPGPPEVTSASSSEATTPLAGLQSDTSSAITRDYQTPKKDTTPLLAPGGSHEKSSERNTSNIPSTASGRKGFLDILKQSPTSDSEGRKPNKLQKKRIPGSTLSSAQSSNHSLHDDHHQETQRSPVSPQFAAAPPSAFSAAAPTSAFSAPAPAPAVAQGPAAAAAVAAFERGDEVDEQSTYATAQSTPTVEYTPHRYPTEATLRPTVSPSHSFQSHTDTSDADMVGDDMPVQPDEEPKEKKRHRWRFSRTQNKLEQPTTPGDPLGTSSAREHATSQSTIGSGGSQPRKSFQEPAPLGSVNTDPAFGGPQPAATSDTVFSDSERERRGPVSWLKNKLQERKDKDSERRSHTPERAHERSKSKQDMQLSANEGLPVRGKSFEQPRAEPSTKVSPPAAQQPVAGSTATAAVQAAQIASTNGERHSENIEPKAAETTAETKADGGNNN